MSTNPQHDRGMSLLRDECDVLAKQVDQLKSQLLRANTELNQAVQTCDNLLLGKSRCIVWGNCGGQSEFLPSTPNLFHERPTLTHIDPHCPTAPLKCSLKQTEEPAGTTVIAPTPTDTTPSIHTGARTHTPLSVSL